MNELMKNTIVKVIPVINFSDYETLKSQAIELAQHINTVEVTEENIKTTKKMLASVNKSIKELNDRRIVIKKEILAPYEIFAEQIKEIESIVRDADTVVRNQVREIEERERQDKKDELYRIWNLRIKHYDFAQMIEFDDWLEPKHLNKSESITQSENNMSDFLEKCERDLGVLSNMEDAKDLIYEYVQSKLFDVADAIQRVNNKKLVLNAQNEVIQDVKQDEVKRYAFVVTGEKDRKLTEMLLKEHEIEFEIKEY